MTKLERILVWSSTAVVAATGIAYAAMKHLMRPADEWAVVNHPLQPYVLKLHILAAPVLVFAIGMIAARHILPQLRAGLARRRSGLLTASVIIPLILSGYLLQAITHSAAVRILGWVHLALGIIFAAGALRHARRGRRATARADRRLDIEPRPDARRNGTERSDPVADHPPARLRRAQ